MAYRTSKKKRPPRKKVMLRIKTAEELGFKKEIKENIEIFLQKCIDDSIFPCAGYSIGGRGGIVAEGILGNKQVSPDIVPLRENDLFDLASVTKFVITTVSIMILMERGRLRLDNPVNKFLPEFIGKNKNKITIQHLLTHTSGLPAWYPLYLSEKSHDKIIKKIYSLDLDYAPNTDLRYSCLGYILLGEIVRIITEKKLDDFAKKNILEPLNMHFSTFNPRVSSPALNTVPTELGNNYEREISREYPGFQEYGAFRDYLIDGEVHDHNCYNMEGYSGNSGLFSTPRDLAYFSEMMLNEGIYAGKRYISPIVVKLMKQNATEKFDKSWGLGIKLGENMDVLRGKLSKKSFGHTGFTGTSIWIDDSNDIYAVLLTNRIHPKVDTSINFDEVRGEFHSIIWDNIATKRV